MMHAMMNLSRRWVTADEIYGNDRAVRRWLTDAGHTYVLTVSCNHLIAKRKTMPASVRDE